MWRRRRGREVGVPFHNSTLNATDASFFAAEADFQGTELEGKASDASRVFHTPIGWTLSDESVEVVVVFGCALRHPRA